MIYNFKKFCFEALDWLNSISTKDIKFKHKYEGLFDAEYIILPLIDERGSAIRYRIKKYPEINDNKEVLELHIDLHPDLQGKGLALKIIKAFLSSRRGKNKTFYISYGRITNKNVYKVIDKMKKDPELNIHEYETGVTISMK